MDNNREPELKQLYLTLEAIAEKIRTLAGESQDNVHKLLCIMRTLEQLHRDIREDLFQPALPNNRHDLYNLLKDIETNGGWPYIHRMQLQELIAVLYPPDAYEQSLLTYSQDARRTSSTMQKYVCTVCGYEYDPQTGDPDSGIEPGTAFEDIPDDWVCPVCGASKEDFEPAS